jgi:hypothetical protein
MKNTDTLKEYTKKLQMGKARPEMTEKDFADQMRKPNSMEQYRHEKSMGGAMTDLSYEEWKKL